MTTTNGITIERNRNGTTTAYWTDRHGYLCRQIFVGYTNREILSLAKQERRERNRTNV